MEINFQKKVVMNNIVSVGVIHPCVYVCVWYRR